MKPNEPMDLMYLPTRGTFLAWAYKEPRPPKRVGRADSNPAAPIWRRLDPRRTRFGYALPQEAVGGVHLNEPDGLKYGDQGQGLRER